MSFSELSAPEFFVLVFIAVLALIASPPGWCAGSALNASAGTTRNRQPRLAVIDAASVDGRRRLVLIRRDNVEHLLMIGGPTDVVVETNIVRGNAAATAREAPSCARTGRRRNLAARRPARRGRPVAAARAERARTEPASAAYVDRGRRRSLAPSPARASRAAREPAWRAVEDDLHWSLPPQVEASPAPQREARTFSGLEAELSRPAAGGTYAGGRSRPKPEPARAPAPSVAPPAEAEAGDQNLDEMANRLEAALRRPVAPGDTRPAVAPKPPVATRRIGADCSQAARPQRTRGDARSRRWSLRPSEPSPRSTFTRGDRGGKTRSRKSKPRAPSQARTRQIQIRPGRSRQPPKTLYDSLEQEMASLLGRPAGKA